MTSSGMAKLMATSFGALTPSAFIPAGALSDVAKFAVTSTANREVAGSNPVSAQAG